MLTLSVAVFILFLAVLGLFCCMGFSLVASGGYSVDAVHRLFTEAASLVAERRL